MMILAIDPGVSGAFAFLQDGQLVIVEDMPVIEVRGKKRVSASRVAEIMRERPIDLVVIEDVHSMPGQGVASSFAFGRSAGLLEGVAAGVGLAVELVHPATWKRQAGVPADKGACRQMAQRYWPACTLWFDRAKDDGRADAALLGRWAHARATAKI